MWRRVRLLPGVSLNLSKSGASVSLGPRGAKVTLRPGSRRLTLGIPGTGLSYTRVATSKTAPEPRAVASEAAAWTEIDSRPISIPRDSPEAVALERDVERPLSSERPQEWVIPSRDLLRRPESGDDDQKGS